MLCSAIAVGSAAGISSVSGDGVEGDFFEDDSMPDDEFFEDDFIDEEFIEEFSGTEERATETDSQEESALQKQIASEGKVLNIECWDEEFKSRVIEYYPGYEVIDGSTGKIGEITVEWHITPEADNAYQNYLDSVLLGNDETPEDDRIDLFLVEDDFAAKYFNSYVSLPLSEIGIEESELSEMYDYTKQLAEDEDGNLCGVTWQCWPGVLIYNRQAAIDTWGTDDPDEVQKHVSNWDEFMTSAGELSDKGYYITASAYDTYSAYASDIDVPWVSADNQVQIRSSLENWAQNSCSLVRNGCTTTADLWSEEWCKGLMQDGNVFCYFGAAWMIEYGLSSDLTDSIGSIGGWGVCAGPQHYFSRGTWLCAAYGTDNPSLVADIMRKMTTDEGILQSLLTRDGDFVNNRSVMAEAADDDRFSLNVLGGQNPVSIYMECAEVLDASSVTPYDIYCDEQFKEEMRLYFEGSDSYEEAVNAFQKAITGRFEELTA